MKITSAELRNFRNYTEAELFPGGGLNVLFGENASGKTNFVESIILCSFFRSPRTTKDKELILIGKDRATIRLGVEDRFRKHTIFLQIEASGKKKVAVDGIPIQRAGELLGVLGVVFFSPDEMKLIKESPAERRRFLDIGLSQQQRSYFAALSRYNKILHQKNNLLKDNRVSDIDGMLDVWDTQLAEYGAVLTAKRAEYVAELDSRAAEFHSALSGGKEKLRLSYECGVQLKDDADSLRASLLEAVRGSREKDKKLGFATVGPHRDDIKIEIDGRDSRKFASQGQQRTIALAMKLGEVELYRMEAGDPPVLLLDDVLSELDENRQRLLLELTEGVQTFITCTEFNLNFPAKKFLVRDGSVSSAE